MRKIIHIDCDCFFAAVEMRDNPALQGMPIAVGGKASSRGVLATCNYEARKFGLHSAMPTSIAFKKCPQLTLCEPRFNTYKTVSKQIHGIYKRYTSLIEPLSLDEAYLDVSDSMHFQGSATFIAHSIRNDIYNEIGITASAGIAPNKFLAKIASDWNKPNNQFVITPDEVNDFVKSLKVEKIPGIGKVSMKRMQQLNIATCADIQNTSLHILVKNFGRFGHRLKQLCYGLDDRDVSNTRTRKSLSVEHTYSKDIKSSGEILTLIPILLSELSSRLEKIKNQTSIHKLAVKIKFSDFSITTTECTNTRISLEIYTQLALQAFQRKNLPARLLGVGIIFKGQVNNSAQLPLFFNDTIFQSHI
jgi:DNA polymerase-4